MIKNIIFDMGNVLIRYDINELISKAPAQYRQVLKEEVFMSLDWVLMDKGEIETEAAKSNMKSRIPDKAHKWVDSFVDEWHDEIPPYPDMEKLVLELKEADYKIYLLSNASKRFHIFRENIAALKYFDGEFVSADWHLLKPDPAIYESFFKHFCIKAEESYFIDDNSLNILAANACGMVGFVYHGDINKLRAHMLENGIRLLSK